jgi:hypothetical protein
MKLIRNCLFKNKTERTFIKGCYYSTEVYMNDDINIGFRCMSKGKVAPVLN